MSKSTLPPFPVTVVGSWPRSDRVLQAQRAFRRGRMTHGEFDAIADTAVIDVLRLQEQAGLDMVTDGEQRRDNYFSFVATKLEGVRLMTLAEMLEVVEDKAGFERILQSLDVPAFAISNATCVGEVARRQSLAVDELRFVRRHTGLPVKVALPGPYLLTRAMYVPELSRAFYPSKEALGDAVVTILRDEIADLIAEGADFIQLDEPVVTELAFSRGQTRTFMCAALAARGDPTEELAFALELLNRVATGWGDAVRIGVHVCRGNWSRDESTLLSGSYEPLRAYLDGARVQQLVLEFATPRAGTLARFEEKELGLGVVNPRIDVVESESEIDERVHRACTLYPLGKLFLNPDCGFATFAQRPVADVDLAMAKLARMVEVARRYR